MIPKPIVLAGSIGAAIQTGARLLCNTAGITNPQCGLPWRKMSPVPNIGGRKLFGKRQSQTLGWISVSGRPKIPCTIKSLTAQGAVLEVATPDWLPFQFELAIEPEGHTLTCQTKHKRPSVLIVDFVMAQPREPSGGRYQPILADSENWRGIGGTGGPRSRTK